MKLRISFVGFFCLQVWMAFAAPVDIRSAGDFLRALQKVQDEIARGDISALALQKPLSEELLNALENPLLNIKEDHGWAVAAIGYSLNGAHPKVSRRLLAQVSKDNPHYKLAQAVSQYTTGNMKAAALQLSDILLDRTDPRLAPYVALAAATANLDTDQVKSVRLFELATILGPGTLVEEVALRRLANIAVEKHDSKLLEQSANLYMRRYSNSPFVGQFMSLFAAHAAELLSEAKTMEMLSLATAQKKASAIPIALSLAEYAAMAGKMEMVSFIVETHLKSSPINAGAVAEKIKLYELIASQSKPGGFATVSSLPKIDSSQLSPNEKLLLSKSRMTIEAIYKPLSTVEKDKSEIANKIYESKTEAVTGDTVADKDAIKPVVTTENEKFFVEIETLAKNTGAMLESVDQILKE